MQQNKTTDWVRIKYQHKDVLRALKSWENFTINQKNTKKMLRACYEELRKRKNANENITIFKEVYPILKKHFSKPKPKLKPPK